MSYEKDRFSSSWAQIALFADLTWAADPPDDFVIANRRLWIQHCYLAQLLETSLIHPNNVNLRELPDKRPQYNEKYESGVQSSRDRGQIVSPETRLNHNSEPFYFEVIRESAYTSTPEESSVCGVSGRKGSEALECWMLPEVEYWCKKMMETSSDSRRFPQRSRLYKRREDDFEHAEEYNRAVASLAARVESVRSLWHQPVSAPPTPRKMRARRRKPKRLMTSTPPPYNLQATVPLVWKPNCKFQLQSQQGERQKKGYNFTKGSVQRPNEFVPKASPNKWPLYRGTNVSRYTPTSQRPVRYFEKKNTITWPKINTSPRNNTVMNIKHSDEEVTEKTNEKSFCVKDSTKVIDKEDSSEKTNKIFVKSETLKVDDLSKAEDKEVKETLIKIEETTSKEPAQEAEIKKSPKKVNICERKEIVAEIPVVLEKKRLYSTVLSTQPTTTPIVKTTKKTIIPGLIKLNQKIKSTTRIRLTNVDDLEKEALEQYKASDESIDTKFNELEKQAVEQYSTSNSNTSCSSGNSAEKPKANKKTEQIIRKNTKNCKEKVNSLIITSQKFSDQQTLKGLTSNMNLKNFQTPPRGDKKEPKQKPHKNQRKFRKECQRAASDTDYEFNELKNHKGPKKWMLRITPKKRHLKVCASDTSDEETRGLIKVMNVKNKIDSKVKKYDRAGGDLNPVIRKSN